ncbi:MAG TPA: hypothetical protein VFT84_06405, partial [Gemmatimonadales bacterium]|nr:hypothetical protein [Gemmatimonadales bacterium]
MTSSKIPIQPREPAPRPGDAGENRAGRQARHLEATGAPPASPPSVGRVAKPRRRHLRASAEVELRLLLARTCDTAAVLATLLGVFIVTNLGHMPSGFREFLALRVTVRNLVYLVAFVVVWRLVAWIAGLYQWQLVRRKRAEFARVALACTLMSAVALVFPLMSVTGAFRYSAVFYFWVTATAAILVLRSLLRTLLSVPESGTQREAIIVGTGPRALRLEAELRERRPDEYKIVGFMDPDGRPGPEFQRPFLGTLDDIESVLMR